MEVHNRLRELRARHGFTQEALADVIGMSRQTVIALEKGRYNPSVQLALLVAKAMGEPVESLFWLEPSSDDDKGVSP